MPDIKAQNETALASVKAIYDAADEANTLLDGMQTAATQAGTTLNGIYADAESAKSSAENASEYASRALGNLASVQSVTETLNWITAHGTMTLTSDTALDPSHVYFVVDANGDYVVGGTHYSVVSEPSLDDISTYYELSINESLNNYVATHLVVDTEGLWIIPDSGGNKVLIATGSGSTYTTAGTYIVSGSTVLASFTSDGAQVGEVESNHLNLTAEGIVGYNTEKLPFFDVNMNGATYILRNTGLWSRFIAETDNISVGSFSTFATGQYNPEPDRTSGLGFYFNEGDVIGMFTNGEPPNDYCIVMLKPKNVLYTFNTSIQPECTNCSVESFDSENLNIRFTFSEAISTESTQICSVKFYTSTGAYVVYRIMIRCNEDADLIIIEHQAMASASTNFNLSAMSYGDALYLQKRTTTKAPSFSFGTRQVGADVGVLSSALGESLIGTGKWQFVTGAFNEPNDDYAVIVGNGTSDTARSNAFTVDWSGNVVASGDVTDGNGITLSSLYHNGIIVVSSATFTSLPQTITYADITSEHVAVNWTLTNPSAQAGDWTVTTSNGSVTIDGTISGSTAITLYLAPTNTADKNGVLVVSDTITSLPKTITNADISVNHVLLNSVLSVPSLQTDDWTVTTSDGSVTITGTKASGSTDITLYLGNQTA